AAGSAPNQRAFTSLRSGWQAFLRDHDPSRPIVLIGHSQGAAMLMRLLHDDIDPDPAVRRQVALALVLGGNFTVATGKLTGGTTTTMPLCDKRGEAGCVIAYSSFPSQPPALSFFGRPGGGVSLLSGES